MLTLYAVVEPAAVASKAFSLIQARMTPSVFTSFSLNPIPSTRSMYIAGLYFELQGFADCESGQFPPFVVISYEQKFEDE